MKMSLFIVDDHYMVIEGIRSLLQNETTIEWMGHATNAASCLSFLQRQLPDILLMDINLPDKSGIDLCKEVKEKYPSLFVIGLSTFNQRSFIEKIMGHGASGYLLKNASRQELMDAIQTVIKGRTYLSFEAAQVLQKKEEMGSVLTRRELEVLGLIAEGMTNNEIARALFIGITTVDTHRKNLLTKLEVKNTAALVRKAVQLELIRV